MKLGPEKMLQFKQVKQTQPRHPMCMRGGRERKLFRYRSCMAIPIYLFFCLKRLKLELHTVPIKVKTSKEHEMDMGEMMSSD